MADQLNVDKMMRKRYNLGKTYKDFINLQISFYTRFTTSEVIFGNRDEEEENLAYSIL